MPDVTFIAAVNKVQTLADGGLRVTFDLPEDAIGEVAYLMQYKCEGVAVRVECTPVVADNAFTWSGMTGLVPVLQSAGI